MRTDGARTMHSDEDDRAAAPAAPPAARIGLAWAVHFFTASGAVAAFLALQATFADDFRAAFLWLILAVAIDSVDGWLARAAQVKRYAPRLEGGRLDDVVDYASYVFVPAVIVWRAGLTPPGWAEPTAAAMLLASACGFARTDAKTTDYFFTGFPSYWNIVVLYMYAAPTPPMLNAVLLMTLAALVFAPMRFVYPSRTPELQKLTVALCAVWGALLTAVAWRLPDRSWVLLLLSTIFPIYYLALSFRLARRRS